MIRVRVFSGRTAGNPGRPGIGLTVWLRAAACILIFVATVSGQPVVPAIPLTVEDAVALGLAASEEVKVAESQSREAKTGIQSAWSTVLPRLDGQFSYTHTVLNPVSFTLPSIPGQPELQLPFGQNNTYDVSLLMSQPLYRPGALKGIRIARDFFRSSLDQEEDTRLEVVLGICETYYNALLAERLAGISIASAAQLDEQLKDVRLQRQVGNASDLDLLRVQVNRDNEEPGLADARNAYDDALLNLKQLINLPIDAQVRLADAFELSTFEPLPESEINEMIGQGIDQAPRMRIARRQVRIRHDQVAQARGAFYPSIDVTSTLGEQAFPQKVIPNRTEFNDNLTAGVRINIPIFAGFDRRARLKAARERLVQAEHQLEQTRQALATQIENTRRQLQRATELISTRERTVQGAAKVFELAELGYDQGNMTHLELSDARLNLARSRANQARAVHGYYLAYLVLIRTLGVPAQDFARVHTLSSQRGAAQPDEKQ